MLVRFLMQETRVQFNLCCFGAGARGAGAREAGALGAGARWTAAVSDCLEASCRLATSKATSAEDPLPPAG